MSTAWFYVDGQERVGPVEEDNFLELFKNGTLNNDSFIWRTPWKDWKKAGTVEEISGQLGGEASAPAQAQPAPAQESVKIEQETVQEVGQEQAAAPTEQNLSIAPQATFSWEKIDKNAPLFTLKIGSDRGEQVEAEYGPYSLQMIKRLYDENRVSAKTFIFTPGLADWIPLGDIPIFEEVFAELPPTIEEQDRRASFRKPFVARMLFHNENKVFEGVCRDISIGGMQVLVPGYPGQVGDQIAINVHPGNSDHHFTASGQIVRFLPGRSGFSFRFTDIDDQARSAILGYLNT